MAVSAVAPVSPTARFPGRWTEEVGRNGIVTS